MRRLLRLLLVLGMAGTLAELVLLEHTEGYWQKAPLGLLAVGLAATLAESLRPNSKATVAMKLAMILMLAGGVVGLYQHFMGNREFELEMNASRGGFELLWETLKGATPALAPGALIYLGLIGLASLRPERDN